MKHVIETNEHGTVTIEFVSKFRMPNAIECFEFKTDRDFEIDEHNHDFFRLERHETAGYATIAAAHEYGDGDDNYLTMGSADHIFDVAQVNAIAQMHKDSIKDDQDLYDEWAAEYDDDEPTGKDPDGTIDLGTPWADEDSFTANCGDCGKDFTASVKEPVGDPMYCDPCWDKRKAKRNDYDGMLKARDADMRTRTLELGFEHDAPYAEMELWQAVLSHVNEMTFLFPGEMTDVQKNITSTCEGRIEWLKGRCPRIEDYDEAQKTTPKFYAAEEAKRAHYIQDLAVFCRAWPGYQNDGGEIDVPRDKVAQVLRTLNAYRAEHGQMMCNGWDDGDYQEVTWEMYLDWMRNDGQIPDEHERFILV